MASNALYNIFASKCFSLAHTMVIHSGLLAKSQNTILEQKGYRINHNNPKTWKYYLNLSGQYHDYDKQLIAELNGDGYPYMRIKVAGDNQPILVDFTKELLTGETGDYSLAAEYSYGSSYYTELVKRYPGFESLILGILNPIDIELAVTANDGDVLYCGGYYRKRLPGLKELYGFEQREDVKIDAEFLIEEWEQDIIFQLQDYIQLYLKRWVIPDFQANHTYYSAVMWSGLMGGLICEIHRLRLANAFSYAAHTYHVREYINSFGYLGNYADVLTRDQAMYLYQNMSWLTANKGKQKVLDALVDNLLTPAGIPLVGYRLGHDTWDMQANGKLNPTIEFKKEYLNLDPLTNDIGTSTLDMLVKEEFVARDNGLFVDEQVRDVEAVAQISTFNNLNTKVLESDFVEVDNNVFFNLEEFQFHHWIYAVAKGNYRGSIFVGHPVTGGRLQLTPLTALVLLLYAYTKGYYGYALENVPPFMVRNIPRLKSEAGYPSKNDLWMHSTSTLMTQAKIDKIANQPQPIFEYTSTTDFNTKTKAAFDTLELRRAYAAAEEDIFANAELELIVSKFYHLFVEIPPLLDVPYKEWLNNIGIDVSKLTDSGFRALADELMLAGLGNSDTIEKSTERMHEAIINIVRFFLSYNVQLVSKFTKSNSRTYGYKNLRLSLNRIDTVGVAHWMSNELSVLDNDYHSEHSSQHLIQDFIFEEPHAYVVGESKVELIDMVVEQATYVTEEQYVDLGGFHLILPDEQAGNEPYSDLIIKNTRVLVDESLPDYIDVSGQLLAIELEPLGINFVNTYGLKEIGKDDFEFTIKFEE